MTQIRLNDYARIILTNGGSFKYQSRTQTGRGKQFGSAQNVFIPAEEMKQIVEAYKEHTNYDEN